MIPLKQWFLTGVYLSPKTFVSDWRNFQLSGWDGAISIQWVEAMAPNGILQCIGQTPHNHLVQNIHSAGVEKPCS